MGSHTHVDDDAWQQFHQHVNMTSRELDDGLREAEAGDRREPLPDRAGPSVGREHLAISAEHRVDLGHDPLRLLR